MIFERKSNGIVTSIKNDKISKINHLAPETQEQYFDNIKQKLIGETHELIELCELNRSIDGNFIYSF